MFSISPFGNTLSVSKIKFESPGSVDFLGIGKLFEQIADLVKFYFPNKETKLRHKAIEIDTEGRIIENEILKEKLLNSKIQNFKEMGFETSEIQTMIGIEYSFGDKLKKLIQQGKIEALNIKEIGKE